MGLPWFPEFLLDQRMYKGDDPFNGRCRFLLIPVHSLLKTRSGFSWHVGCRNRAHLRHINTLVGRMHIISHIAPHIPHIEQFYIFHKATTIPCRALVPTNKLMEESDY